MYLYCFLGHHERLLSFVLGSTINPVRSVESHLNERLPVDFQTHPQAGAVGGGPAAAAQTPPGCPEPGTGSTAS
jgi:hypothetical protein